MKKLKPTNCHECEQADCYMLNHCSADWIDFVNKSKSCFQVKKGEPIFNEGDKVEGVYFIQEGKAKVFKVGVNHKEQIFRFVKSGDILGFKGWEREKMSISASALENSKICFINRNDFDEILKNNSKLTYDLMSFYANELYKSEVKARNLAQMSVVELVATSLLYIYKVYGENKEGYLDVCLSRQELASLSGTTKEQVSKYLSEFNEEGIIITDKRAIKLLSTNKLRKISEKYLEKLK